MFNESDRDLYAVETDAEHYIWLTWILLVLLSSVLGNTITLVSSIKYNAFELHKAIVTLIQHIAVCDLLLVFSLTFPQTVSFIAKNWIMGKVFYYINTYGTRYCYPVSMLLVAALTSTKLFLVQYPLAGTSFTRKRAHILCAGIWIISSYYPGSLLLVDKDDTYFDFRLYAGMYAFSAPKWKLLVPILFGIMGILPNLVIVITSILLIKHLVNARRVARKSGGKIRWQGIATVLLTAVVFVVSSMPLTVYNYCAMYVRKEHVFFHIYYFRTAYSLVYFNVISNVFIYGATVPSFKKFLKIKATEIMVLLNLTAAKSGEI